MTSLSKAAYEAIIERQGRIVSFIRGASTVNVRAHVRRSRNDPPTTDLTGGMVEDGYMVICSNKEMVANAWPFPPYTGDRILFDGEYHMVRAVYPLFLSDDLVGYRVQVSG